MSDTAANLATLTAAGAVNTYTTTVAAGAAAATALTAIDAATTVAVGAANVTSITGTAAEVAAVAAAITAGTITHGGNFTANTGNTTVAQANAIDAVNGTGVLTASLSDTIANALTLTRVGNLNAYAVTVTDATTAAQFNTLSNLTSGVITLNSFVDGFQNVAAAPVAAFAGNGLITANGTGIANTIDLSALPGTGKLTVLAGAGNDTVFGSAGVDTINGGTGTDNMTGGAGADIFVFAAGDSGQPSATVFDVITDFASASDVIDHAAAITITAGNVAAGAGTATISAGGVATFNGADNTLAAMITAAEAGINANGNAAAGQAVLFQGIGGDAANAYLFISDGVDGVGVNDVLIQLVGVDTANAAFDTLTINGAGNATLA